MLRTRYCLVIAMALVGCRRDDKASTDKAPPAPTTPPVAAAPADAAPAPAEPPKAADEPRTWYRASLRAKDDPEVVFLLGLPPPGGHTVVVRAGEHDVTLPAERDASKLTIQVPVHSVKAEATIAADGTLKGTFSTSSPGLGVGTIDLAATPVAEPATKLLATVPAGPPIDLKEPVTYWKLAITDAGAGRLEVHQREPGVFDAIILRDSGKYDYLAGTGAGNALVLTGFDGTSGFRLDLTLSADRKQAKGKWSLGSQMEEKHAITAKRGPDFTLAIAHPGEPGKPIKLPALPELDALPAKPMFIELAGSWCSTCRNAAPHIVELAKEYRPKGIEFVTLLYEFTDNPATDDVQAKEFRKAYNIDWPVIPVPGVFADYSEILPQGMGLVDPEGFPVTVFVRADRTVEGVHVGFPASDAAKVDYDKSVAEMRKHLDALLTAH